MLSTDENILKNGSEVRSRMLEYGTLAEELHIIVLTAQNYQSSSNNSQPILNFQISKNVWAYPTNSLFKLNRIFSAHKIAAELIYKLQAVSCKLLVTCQDPFETGLIGYFLKKKFKIPLHIQIHTDFLSPYFAKESLKNKIRVFIAKRIISKADGIRVVSERIRKSIVTQLPNYSITRISILPIFIDIEKIKNATIKTDLHKKYPGKFIILMASRLTREKNIGLAIKSINGLIHKYPDLLLLIVGSGPEEFKLKAASRKLQSNIVFETWSNDLPSYYKTADLFLLTSYYEGYGMTAIEATAAGLPILMTDVGVAAPTLSRREVGAPTPDVGVGSVIPIGDSKELTKSLDILISNSLEREKILENQKRILDNVPSKDEYLGLIKHSWSRCLNIENPRFQSK
jgi:glycosyltransferase involved in cell wall biosynthesis